MKTISQKWIVRRIEEVLCDLDADVLSELNGSTVTIDHIDEAKDKLHELIGILFDVTHNLGGLRESIRIREFEKG